MHRNHIRTDIEQDVCPGNRNKCTAVLDRNIKDVFGALIVCCSRSVDIAIY